jgi:hypothetical protein
LDDDDDNAVDAAAQALSPPPTAAMDDDRRYKRSRFDQTESESRRSSRFDRRSRSPAPRRPESFRERSPPPPPPRQGGGSGSQAGDNTADARAAAAAAAAARIKEQLEARRGIQHVDVPPIRHPLGPPAAGLPPRPPVSLAPATASSPGDGGDAGDGGKPPSDGPDQPSLVNDIYVTDGDYIKDIEVNDLRNRYTLTRGPTQKMVITVLLTLVH